MVQKILDLASSSNYDFRNTACPDDPLKHRFEEWVPCYRLKWAIASALQPRNILEVGVRFGYSAAAFLDACPQCRYLGIDNDSDTFGGHKGAINWARRITLNSHAEYLIADSQTLDRFPGGTYDLIHVDGQQDGAGSLRDLRKALHQAKHVLVDGFFWSRDNFLHVSEFVYIYRDLIESCVIIPGYSGELLVTFKEPVHSGGPLSSSESLRDTYTTGYYLQSCGGFDAFKQDKGLSLTDLRLKAVAQLTENAPVGRALDLGCGRGEIAVHLARLGNQVQAIDYSKDAIELARAAAGQIGEIGSRITFHCCNVNDAPLSGLYDVAVASDLIEHLTPGELDRLYFKVASHLSPNGIFVIHTFPNLWYYKYGHARRLREAHKLGAYVPLEPRTRYEELMHINEQSPRVLKRQISSHFKHMVLWFADHDLANPFENLKRPFSTSEMRMAGDLFAIASHAPVDLEALLKELTMLPLPAPLDLSLECLKMPAAVRSGDRFRIPVRLTNNSGVELKSRNPNPVHLSYHWFSEDGQVVTFDGIRTPIPLMPAGHIQALDMNIVAPSQSGPFLLRLTLVQELVRWFEDPPEQVFVDSWVDVRVV